MGIFGLSLPKKKDIQNLFGGGSSVQQQFQARQAPPVAQPSYSDRQRDDMIRAIQRTTPTATPQQRAINAAQIKAIGIGGVPTWESVSAPTNAITRAGQGVINVATNRNVAPVALGIGRSVVGTGEGLSGLYDLMTPGQGTNRFGKSFTPMGASLDNTVQQGGYNPWAYKAAQAGTDIGSFFLGGLPLVKGATMANKGVKLLPGAAKLGKMFDTFADSSKAGKVIVKAGRYAARPDVASDVAADVALSQGLRSNRGQDVGIDTIGQDAALSYGMAGGLNLTGKGAKKVYSAAKEGVGKIRNRTPAPDVVPDAPPVPQAPRPTPKVTVRNPADSPSLAPALADGRIGKDIDRAPINSLRRGSDSLSELDEAKVQQIMKDRMNHKAIDPIIIDDKGNIIDGQHRWEAFKRLGDKDIPVVYQKTPKKLSGAAQQSAMGKVKVFASKLTVGEGGGKNSPRNHDEARELWGDGDRYNPKPFVRNPKRSPLTNQKSSTGWTVHGEVQKSPYDGEPYVARVGTVRKTDKGWTVMGDYENTYRTRAEASEAAYNKYMETYKPFVEKKREAPKPSPTPEPKPESAVVKAPPKDVVVTRPKVEAPKDDVTPPESSIVKFIDDISETKAKGAGTPPPNEPPRKNTPDAVPDSPSIPPNAPKSTVDPDDPFGNKNIFTKIRNEFGNLIDDDSQMIKLLQRIEKETGRKGLVEDWYFNTGNIRSSESIANSKLRQSADVKEAVGGLRGKEFDELDAYAAARAETGKGYEGKKTSKSRADNEAIIKAGDKKYAKRFEAMNRHYKQLAQDLHDAGIIDAERLKKFQADENYIHIQRDMEPLLNQKFGGGQSRSIGTTTVSKKRKGSSREILSPTRTLVERTQRIQLEVQRNKAATDTIDVLEETGIAKPLVNADDVISRRQAFRQLKELKPVRDQLQKEVRKSTKLIKELTSRNKELSPKILDKLKSGASEVRGKAIVVANDGKRAVNRPDSKRLSKAPDEADIQEAFEQYLDGNPKLVQRMYEFMGNQSEARRLTQNLDAMKAKYDAVKKKRSDIWLDAQTHTSKVTTNKNTIKRFRNGVAEVYEVPADIKKVMDNVNPYQLGVIAKVVSIPVRALKLGATALSAPFAATNYARDQVSSALVSKDVFATHNPKNVAMGLARAAQDYAGVSNDPVWKKFETYMGDQTKFDELRNPQNAKNMLRELSQGTKGKWKNRGSSVDNWMRTVEDAISITEKATRFQNFKGTYDQAIKAGLGEDAAIKKAVLAARQNSTDFQRSSSFIRAVNLFIPYFGAGIQGSRTMARSFKERPVSTSMKSVGYIVAPTIAMTAWNLSDEKRKEAYESINDFEKQDNFIVVGPDAKQQPGGSWTGVWKIPKPQGFRELTDPARDMAEAFMKGEKVENVAKMFTDMMGAMTGTMNIDSPMSALGSITPQQIKPLVQAGMNKDFYADKQTVPDFMNDATDAEGNPIPEEQKAYSSTSGTAKIVGRAINQSPVKVEKFASDTFGSVGRYGVNLSDNILARTGKIKQDEIGGRSIATDFSRRLFEASGETLERNKTAGQKYFENVEEAQKGLTANEKAAWTALHPQKKNFLGDQIYEREAAYDPAARLDIYNRYDKVFQADKQLDAKNRKDGKPGNPMFDLEKWQLKKVLEKENLPPGAKDPELTNLFEKDWYVEYRAKKGKFFDDIRSNLKKDLSSLEGKTTRTTSENENLESMRKAVKKFESPDNPYPETSPALQKAMDTYSSIPSGTGRRSAWIKSNPGAWTAMQQQFAKVDNWQNIARGKRGLDMTEGEIGKAAGYGDQGGFGGSSGPKDYTRTYSIGGNTGSSYSGGRSAKITVKSRRKGKIKVTSSKTRVA